MDRDSNVANIAVSRKVNAAALPLMTLTAWQVCLTLHWFALRQGRAVFEPDPEVQECALGQPFLARPAAFGAFQLLAALGQRREKPEIDIHGLETSRTTF